MPVLKDFASDSDKNVNSSEQPNNNAQKPTDTPSDGKTNDTPSDGKTNDGLIELAVTVNGKQEVMKLTTDEIARYVQLGKASTQKFQEASDLRKQTEQERQELAELRKQIEQSNNHKPEERHHKPNKKDYDDDVYRKLKETTDELNSLKEQFGQVTNTIRTRETEERINNITNKYGVDRDYIDKNVLPYMAKEGIDNIEVGIKALLFENGKTKSSTITPDNSYKQKSKKSNADAIFEALLGASQTTFDKLNKM
jgi:hypothetical protein